MSQAVRMGLKLVTEGDLSTAEISIDNVEVLHELERTRSAIIDEVIENRGKIDVLQKLVGGMGPLAKKEIERIEIQNIHDYWVSNIESIKDLDRVYKLETFIEFDYQSEYVTDALLLFCKIRKDLKKDGDKLIWQ